MTSPDPLSSPPKQSNRRHTRVRAVPLRPTRFPVKRTINLGDSRVVYLAAKKRGVSEGEFMRTAVMREASRILAEPNRRTG
jgi:hypothetical protein